MVKSNDFEVHPIGTAQELKITRDLVIEMAQLQKQYGTGIFHKTISDKLNVLLAFYDKLIETERYENGI